MKKDNCIKYFNITRGTSPWQGLTSSYTDEEESKTILSADTGSPEYIAIPSLERYSVNGKKLIGRNDRLKKVAVNSDYFTQLHRADATRKTSGRILIGTCKPTMLQIYTCGQVAEFLIESQIVNTFWHVESTFCLDAEQDTGELYSAHYKGKHIYYTNSYNEEGLDFTIIIIKKTGEMFVEVR